MQANLRLPRALTRIIALYYKHSKLQSSLGNFAGNRYTARLHSTQSARESSANLSKSVFYTLDEMWFPGD